MLAVSIIISIFVEKYPLRMKNKQHFIVEMLTPKESNVYSKLACRTSYDSYGVEHGYGRYNSYKHTIHSGLAF